MREPTAVQQTRRDVGPITDRGAARRRQLLDAARRVFERQGFTDARVADIVKEAHASHGTFYTYFDTKEAIFVEVARTVIEDMHEDMAVAVPTSGLDLRVHDAIDRFIHAYRPNAAIIALMEQLALDSVEMRALRLDLRDSFVQRTRRGIERMQADGSVPADLDVEYTAEALGAMLEYTCHLWFSLGKEFEERRLADALAGIWFATLHPEGHGAP
ncbi:TetR/AcrR family transcriptional regulator [Aeromicrobium alkaliterrae]|uniref:TetR/AcrR family transcriptional regulator n=1 Tax=Aeromicrobium alkaliterrae TaxID=302168 RepID=A0ABP4W3P7_9ACTN